RVVGREPRELDPRADPALLRDALEIAGQAVGEVDHGRHAGDAAERLPRTHAGHGPEVRAREVASLLRSRLEQGQASGGAAQGTGDRDQISGPGSRPELRARDGFAEDGEVDDPARWRRGRVAADDGDV